MANANAVGWSSYRITGGKILVCDECHEELKAPKCVYQYGNRLVCSPCYPKASASVTTSPREGDGATASKWTVKCKDCWPVGDGVLLCESHASYALLLARLERLEGALKDVMEYIECRAHAHECKGIHCAECTPTEAIEIARAALSGGGKL